MEAGQKDDPVIFFAVLKADPTKLSEAEFTAARDALANALNGPELIGFCRKVIGSPSGDSSEQATQLIEWEATRHQRANVVERMNQLEAEIELTEYVAIKSTGTLVCQVVLKGGRDQLVTLKTRPVEAFDPDDELFRKQAKSQALYKLASKDMEAEHSMSLLCEGAAPTPAMRAKFVIDGVQPNPNDLGESLTFRAVYKDSYPEDGSDENNTFARWTPSARLEMYVCNPALVGKFKEGDTFYVDFTKV